MPDEQYQRLRRAIIAYDKALRAYGVMVEAGGDQWIDSSELDRLWAAVLKAADINSPVREDS